MRRDSVRSVDSEALSAISDNSADAEEGMFGLGLGLEQRVSVYNDDIVIGNPMNPKYV